MLAVTNAANDIANSIGTSVCHISQFEACGIALKVPATLHVEQCVFVLLDIVDGACTYLCVEAVYFRSEVEF